ncbi:MAG TPA: hypothetical protein VK356_01895, partial [Thermomicrobiales bacterium]|nr:hypothetical protein [Thermomicrobiales bacterium]
MRQRASKIGVFAAVIMAAGMVGGPAANGQAAGPNGKIVYEGFNEATSQTDLYTMEADGTGVTPLTNDDRDENNPEWSPDGTRISFDNSGLDGGSCCSRSIYVMNANGSGRQRLTSIPNTTQGEDYQATWAPDGTWLAFTSTRDETREFASDREIYRMDPDGTQQAQLTATDANITDEQPTVSSNGTIAFASNRADPSYEMLDIYKMNADGTGVTRLTFDGAYASPQPFQSLHPAWSPDGTRIAFESTRSGNREIWVMDADGSNLVNVSNHASYDAEPAWAPDGTQITFTSLRGGDYDVWAVDAPAAAPATVFGLSLLRGAGADVALAASTPVNLTAGQARDAQDAHWGTTPTEGVSCT